MIALFKLVVFGFIALSVVYVLVSIYSRSVRREKLEKRWDARMAEEAGAAEVEDREAARDAFVEAGMLDYQTGLRRKLIWLVYVIPTAVMLTLLYVLNFM